MKSRGFSVLNHFFGMFSTTTYSILMSPMLAGPTICTTAAAGWLVVIFPLGHSLLVGFLQPQTHQNF